METVSERLKEALTLPGREPRSMRQLHRDLREAGTFDKAFSSMYAYFTGETEPPVSFVVVAAKELGVNAEWLFTGRGYRTPEEGFDAADAAHQEFLRKVDGALQDESPAPLSPDARKVFFHCWNRIRSDGDLFPMGQASDVRFTPTAFARALFAPFKAMEADFGPPDGIRVERYVLDVAPAMANAVRDLWKARAAHGKITRRIDDEAPTGENDG